MAVFCRAQDEAAVAVLLAGLPGLQMVQDIAPDDAAGFAAIALANGLDQRFALRFERDQLLLCRADKRQQFGSDAVALDVADLKRRGGKPSELQRACLGAGGQGGQGVELLDAFAGWGLDGLALAAAGAQVTCVEWQPALVALLRDACRRVPVDALQPTVVHGDALQVLTDVTPAQFAVIYLDPMFPVRKKGALPNKRLQWLAELCAHSALDVERLLRLARRKAGSRVVLKRRRKDSLLGKPERQVIGTSVRYDLYLPED